MDEINNLYNHIMMAQREALIHDIRANVVAINDKLAFSKLRCIEGNEVPMICGLKCVYTEELPDEMTFAVLHAENPPLSLAEENKMLREEILFLRDKLHSISKLINRGVDNG